MSGLGSAIVDGRCTGFSMACHRVGDVPATYKPGPRKPAVDDAPSGKPAPLASGKSVAPATFSMTNKSTSPICTIDGFTQKMKKTGGNFAKDKLRARGSLSLGKLPADLAMLRVVSCDKKVVGITSVTPSKPAAFTIVRGTAKGYGELELQSAKAYAGSPFAVGP